MTKHPIKIKYFIILLCGLLEISSFVGAYAANHYTKTRMGMLRHVVYLNGKWEETLPVPTLKWIVVFVIIGLTILMILNFLKRSNHGIINWILFSITILIHMWALYFIIFKDAEIYRAYYIMSMGLIFGTILQNILYHIHSSLDMANKLYPS